MLVVDDNVDAAESLAMLLQAGGHDVRVAHHSPAGVQAAISFAPAAVLLDIGGRVPNPQERIVDASGSNN